MSDTEKDARKANPNIGTYPKLWQMEVTDEQRKIVQHQLDKERKWYKESNLLFVDGFKSRE